MPHYDIKKYTNNSTAAHAAADDLQLDYPGKAVAVICTSPGAEWFHDRDDQFVFRDHFEVPNEIVGTTGYDVLVMDPKRKSYTIRFGSEYLARSSIRGYFIKTQAGHKFVNFEFPAFYVRSWHQAHHERIDNLRLKDLCVPKTHDSGMYELMGSTFFGNRRGPCLTQSRSIYDQLQLGARWFDIRPFFFQGQWVIGHFEEIKKGDITKLIENWPGWVKPLAEQVEAVVAGWQGGIGPTIEEVVNDVNKFSSTTQELIVLDISHITNVDNDQGVTDDLQNSLFEILSKIRNVYRDPNPMTVNLGDKKMLEYINGRSSVLVTLDSLPEDKVYSHGFYRPNRLNLHGQAFGRWVLLDDNIRSIMRDPFNLIDERSNEYSVYNINTKEARKLMPQKVRELFGRDDISYLEMDYLENVDNLGISLALTLYRANTAAEKRETIIIYGGSVITSPEVKAQVEAAIATGSDYLVSNETLGGDPWVGIEKSCVVWYYNVKGDLRARFAWEAERLRFGE